MDNKILNKTILDTKCPFRLAIIGKMFEGKSQFMLDFIENLSESYKKYTNILLIREGFINFYK